MVGIENFTNTITMGIYNPDCAFYVGAFMGSMNILRIFLIICGINLVYDLVKNIFRYSYKIIKHRLNYGYWKW